MYPFIRKIFFLFAPETAHAIALNGLSILYQSGLMPLFTKKIHEPLTCMNLSFSNRIGLAAGLDKNGDYVDALASLGFGFIEIGTVTPKPQVGNPRPRLFRLVKEEAIINRMGFNNKGADYVVERLKKIKFRGILGINIGKNRDTPNEKAVDDYLFGFQTFWKYASYITINVSSPNTPGLRDLQHAEFLTSLLATLKQEQKKIHELHHKYVPLVVKISPDLTDDELHETATVLLAQQIDGVIATNTTTERTGVEQSPFAKESGGLSGRPLTQRSTMIIKKLHDILQNRIPIIAVGGVMNKVTAAEKIAAGATLIQVYTGFIYQGTAIINDCLS